jgi:hypothetical protein
MGLAREQLGNSIIRSTGLVLGSTLNLQATAEDGTMAEVSINVVYSTCTHVCHAHSGIDHHESAPTMGRRAYTDTQPVESD